MYARVEVGFWDYGSDYPLGSLKGMTSEWLQRYQQGAEDGRRIDELVRYVETERKMLSVELHDGLAQEMATLWMHLHTAPQTAEPMPEVIERCLAVVQRMYQELRCRMHDLRSPILEGVLLTEALEALTRRTLCNNDLKVVLRCCGALDAADHTLSLVVYRVFQEALRNVVNHSRARVCTMELKRTGDELEGCVRDDGVGFEHEKVMAKERLGMRGMKDRCELLGGKLHVDSQPGEGTTVWFTLPWAMAHQ